MKFNNNEGSKVSASAAGVVILFAFSFFACSVYQV